MKELILSSDNLIFNAKKVHDHLNSPDSSNVQGNSGSRENKDSVNHDDPNSGIRASASGLLDGSRSGRYTKL